MRGLRVPGGPPRRPKYLFGERGSPYEITLMLRKRLNEELANLPPDVLLKSSPDAVINDIVRRYTLSVPVFDRVNIGEYEPAAIELEVPQSSQYGFFAGPGPYFIDATEFKIRIPFTGDKNLFRYSTTVYGTPIEGEVADDAVILTHAAKTPDVGAINREFNERLNRIETTLQFSRDSVSDWNNGLVNIVKPAIEKAWRRIEQSKTTTLGFKRVGKPAVAPPTSRPIEPQMPRQIAKLDVFLSHASEDTDAVARPLYQELIEAGLPVWFDEAALRLGDSLRRKTDEGLARCNYGVVIISSNFLNKEWPQRELDGLAAREIAGPSVPRIG
ncbi:MAG: toll/interleukin-1 receptor domain-containing protein [Bryobacteraceae bacterium]